MKRIVAGVLIALVACVSAQSVDAQQRGGDRRGMSRGRGIAEQPRSQRRRRMHRGKWEWYNDASGVAVGRAVGTFFGSLFRKAQEDQAERPGREATVETDEATLEPWSPGWIAYCKRKYKSFDIKDGRYLSHDGNRYFCK